MGLAASSATLQIKHSSKGVGCLPHHHPWQANEALHVGVRTGYCGSLTTFASWELSMIQLLIGGTVHAHLELRGVPLLLLYCACSWHLACGSKHSGGVVCIYSKPVRSSSRQ